MFRFFHFLLLFIFLAHSSLKKIVTFNSFGQRLLFVWGKNSSWFMMPRKRQTWINTKGTITQASIKFCGWKRISMKFVCCAMAYVRANDARKDTAPYRNDVFVAILTILCYDHDFRNLIKMFRFLFVASWFPIAPKTIFDAMAAKRCWLDSLNGIRLFGPALITSPEYPNNDKTEHQINSNVYAPCTMEILSSDPTFHMKLSISFLI